MQPPPRKGNYAKFLKNLHGEQVAKLQAKNQHECDLLEDIRQFTLKRSAIEKSYSEALLKISSAYLNKKNPNIPDLKVDGGEEKWNMWSVWRTVLEENEKLARARLAAVEVFQQQIADEAKALRTHKMSTSKKCSDQLMNVHKELQLCVQDVDKTKKLYFDEEHSAHDVRDKAKDIEEKLKKKKGSFFQSITSLQKNSAKVSSRRDALEEKSTGARNDYLLSLAAANAHQNRYFLVDLQGCMSTMEAAVYERVAEYLTLMGRTELLTCSATQHSFGKIRDQAQQLTREYNLQCCYLYYPVLKQHIQYEYEPCDSDPVDLITSEQESAAVTLSSEARRWATRIARDNNCVRDGTRKLQLLQALRDSGQKTDPNDPNGPDIETKIDDMKHTIRRAETSKMKAEARIECLRAGGVNVDEWMQEAEALSVQDLPRSGSSLSVRTDASGMADHPSSDSFYDSDNAEPENPPVVDEDEAPDIEVDAMLETERKRIDQLTAGWEDPTTVDWGAQADDGTPQEETDSAEKSPTYKCTAIYSYSAQHPDELSIVESEQLEVIGEGDGDGWLRARNYRGQEGFVPHNYLDVERDEQASPTPGLVTQISFSSVDYTVDGEDPDAGQSPDQISVISVPLAQPTNGTASYCFALYDYTANASDELSFEEGQIILLINKCAHDIDDGWWCGEIDGLRGNFPSLVVEECDKDGEPLSTGEEWTPPSSAPPVFTPPGFALGVPQAQLIITQATPCMEQHDEEEHIYSEVKKPAKCNGEPTAPPPSMPPPPPPENGFNLELSRDQQEQYGSQFQSKPPVEITVDEVPTFFVEEEEDAEEAPERAAPPDQSEPEFGLGVVQLVITAATPVAEDPDKQFPPPEDEEESTECAESEKAPAESEGAPAEPEEPEEPDQRCSPESPQSPPKQVQGGRASIPDELEPDQLARLQDLKESNA
ncbi:FCH and double SH3 domains nervous wreck [Arctopsyche grandis]|uniref:FCH and double SH3 domains nervous wreck n=1 Tax=Arctopsyche grandis TaxID=121162 RepID=UPI00406D9F20